MNVLITWRNDNDTFVRHRNKIYDFDRPQDYTISGPNQMWYNELSWLGNIDPFCSTIWVNDTVVYDDDGWKKDSYWYKEMQISIEKEREFKEIFNVFNKCQKAL